MSAAISRAAQDRCCDINGNPLSLFCRVEQVIEDPEPSALNSRLGQHGEVIGQSQDSLYVCFSDHVVLSVPPGLLRLTPGRLLTNGRR